MISPFPASIQPVDMEAATLVQLTQWFYLRLHGRDHMLRADSRLEEQESDLLLDAYQAQDLSRETRRHFRLAAVSSLQQAVETSVDDIWSAEAMEELCCILPALVYEEEEEDAIARLLLQAANRWPWVSSSRVRLKRQALLTLSDLSWRLVRLPRPTRSFWESIWAQDAVDERDGRKHDFVGEVAGAVFSGIERVQGVAAAFDWLGRTPWRGGYNADLLRKLMPARSQKIGPDALMDIVSTHLIPAMGGNDSKEQVVLEAMRQAQISVSHHFVASLFMVKSPEDRTLSTIEELEIGRRMGPLLPAGYDSESKLMDLVSSCLSSRDSTSLLLQRRTLEKISNAIRSTMFEEVAPIHSTIIANLTISKRVCNQSYPEKSEASKDRESLDFVTASLNNRRVMFSHS